MARLKEFGLHEHAARAYLALLALGGSEARGVSEAAGIPSAKVYATLLQLERRGLARATPGKPRLYAPVPIQEFVERQLREQEEGIALTRANMGDLERLFPLHTSAASRGRARTSTILGRRNIVQHLRACCEAATESIFALSSPSLHDDPAIRKHLTRAAARGVAVQRIDEADAGQRAALGKAFPRLRWEAAGADEDDAVIIAVFDAQQAMMLRMRRGSRGQGREGGSAIRTSEPAFCSALRLLLALQHAAQRDRAPAQPREAPLAAYVDARTFGIRVAEQAATSPREARAILHVDDASDIEQDDLWAAIRLASRPKILVSLVASASDAMIRDRLPPHAEVRLLTRRATVAFAIFDGRQAFLTSKPPASEVPADAFYAITTDRALVRALEDHFETGWAAGPSLAMPAPR